MKRIQFFLFSLIFSAGLFAQENTAINRLALDEVPEVTAGVILADPESEGNTADGDEERVSELVPADKTGLGLILGWDPITETWGSVTETEVVTTLTNADVNTPAPAGAEWGYDPATGTTYYVDSAGNWQIAGTELEVNTTLTAASAGTPAPPGAEFGYDPVTGELFYVGPLGNWEPVPAGGSDSTLSLTTDTLTHDPGDGSGPTAYGPLNRQVITSTTSGDTDGAVFGIFQSYTENYRGENENRFGQTNGEAFSIEPYIVADYPAKEVLWTARHRAGNVLFVSAATGDDVRLDALGRPVSPYDELRPWLTVQAAIDAAVAGDSLHIRPGNYGENIMTLKDGVDLYLDDNALLSGGVINDAGTGGVDVDISGHGDFNLLLGFRIYEGSNVRIEADRVWRTDIGALVRPQVDVRNAGSKVRIHVREEFMSEYACIFCLNGGEIISTGVGPRVQNITHGTASVAVIQAGSTYRFDYDTPMVLDSPAPASTVGGIGHQVFKVVNFGNTVIGTAPGYRNNAPYLAIDTVYGGGNTDSGSILNFNGISGSTVGNYVEITSTGESRANGPMVSYANIHQQPTKTVLRGGSWVQEAGATVAPIRGNRASALNCTLCLAVETMTRDGNTGAATELLSDFTIATNNRIIFRRGLGHNYGGGLDANATVVAQVIPTPAVFDLDFE